jgi:hypothetical protein
VLRGMLHCAVCRRRMQGNWNNEQAYYRCRFPAEYALANRVEHPRAVYLRETAVLPHLDEWLADALAPHRLTETIEQLEAAQTGTSQDLVAERAKQTIAEANAKLARHRAALEAGADPAVVFPYAAWIAQTQAERRNAEAQLRDATCQAQTRMSREQITTLGDSLGSLLAALRLCPPFGPGLPGSRPASPSSARACLAV